MDHRVKTSIRKIKCLKEIQLQALKKLRFRPKPLKPSLRQCEEGLPSRFVSICLNILSVRFSGVDSSSGIFITEDTIL